jgi:S1-C subfamily serine protease
MVGVNAQQHKALPNSTADSRQTNDAETVFLRTASKIVFLIMRKSGELHASASGVILTADGYIGTNYHALEGADAVEIRFFPDPTDSQTYQSFNGAKLLYADPERDVAILKVASKSLPFLECPVGRSCEPRVGETVYAIGNPKGLTNTISGGIVSALRADSGEDIIQHTAPISPGSSGGALVDSNGSLLGMNSWQVADAQNLNFAISAKHLSEALEIARHTTTALTFPSEAPAEGASAPEDRAWQAFQARDYIQAANQAEQAVANGASNSKIYMILGKADIELGKTQDADRYLRQALLLTGLDDKFKQSSRYYLLTILAAKFTPATTSADRLALIRLVEEFMKSSAGSVEDADFYERMREWAASIPAHARSIAGTWWEDSPYTVLNVLCGADYTISVSSNGDYKMELGFGSRDIKSGVSCHLDGTLAPNGDGFAGNATRGVILDPDRFGIGAAEQDLGIYLELSEDLQTIVGVAVGEKIRKGSGAPSKYAASLLTIPPDVPPGSKKSWHFTLHRQK